MSVERGVTLSYVSLLLLGWGLPVLSWWDHLFHGGVDWVWYLLAGCSLLLATLLLLRRLVRGLVGRTRQVLVMFIGVSLLWFHGMGFWAVHQFYGHDLFPPAPKFDQSLHRAWLSALPVMVKLQLDFDPGPMLTEELHTLRGEIERSGLTDAASLLQLAQLHLLQAYRLRSEGFETPFDNTPLDRITIHVPRPCAGRRISSGAQSTRAVQRQCLPDRERGTERLHCALQGRARTGTHPRAARQ